MGGANRYRAALRRLAPWSRAADDISWLAAMAAHDTQWCSTCKKIKEIGLFTGRATCDSCRAKGKRNWKKKQSSLADVNKQTAEVRQCRSSRAYGKRAEQPSASG